MKRGLLHITTAACTLLAGCTSACPPAVEFQIRGLDEACPPLSIQPLINVTEVWARGGVGKTERKVTEVVNFNNTRIAAVADKYSLVTRRTETRLWLRALKTRRSIRAQLTAFQLTRPKLMQGTQQLELEALDVSEAKLTDLPLFEHTLNLSGYDDDKYEALRRLVMEDSDQLARTGRFAKDAKFWVCTSATIGANLIFSIIGKTETYQPIPGQYFNARFASILAPNGSNLTVTRVLSLNNEGLIRIVTGGKFTLRSEWSPLGSRKDEPC
jgi:hypothetical protein